MCSQENLFCTTANKSRAESNSIYATQSGKTYFVQQILKHNRIVYEGQKSIRIFWTTINGKNVTKS